MVKKRVVGSSPKGQQPEVGQRPVVAVAATL
jgi:hypothetical protein